MLVPTTLSCAQHAIPLHWQQCQGMGEMGRLDIFLYQHSEHIAYILYVVDTHLAPTIATQTIATQTPPQDYGYNDFIATVDTVLLGRKTFDQLLSWGDPYPYASQRSIVFSTTLPDQALEAITQDDQGGPTAGRGKSGIGIEIERGAPGARVRALKQKPGNGNIWLVGGSQLAAPLIAEGLVDEMVRGLGILLLILQHRSLRLEGLRLSQRWDTSSLARERHTPCHSTTANNHSSFNVSGVWDLSAGFRV